MSESEDRLSGLKKMVADTPKYIMGVIVTAVIIATVFTAAAPVSFLAGDFSDTLAAAIAFSEATEVPAWPTPTAQPRPQIGIVVGHWGDDNDPGAVCPDGLTELQINQEVAALVQQSLINEGFDAILLKEFDPRLQNYRALALISIHADSCNYINEQATGYKVAASMESEREERTLRLTACMKHHYGAVTGLRMHNSITPDMSSYHAFDEINPDTPAAIVEVGFMNLDRQILTKEPERIAEGLTNGVLCYIYNQSLPE